MSRRRVPLSELQALKDQERMLVCAKHDVWSDDVVRFLPTSFAAQYNHCLDCAVEDGRSFGQGETALLVGESHGNIYQIENKALRKLKRLMQCDPAVKHFMEHYILGDHEAPDKVENEVLDSMGR